MTGPMTANLRHPEDLATVRASYDAVADNYARMVVTDGMGDIRRQPWLRAAVDVFADAVGDVGPVLDVGCGPGTVTAYLAERGAHMGDEDVRRTQAYGDVPVSWTTHRWQPEPLVAMLCAAGLRPTAQLRLGPQDGAGRAVVLAAQRDE